jgi:hypothetical protein
MHLSSLLVALSTTSLAAAAAIEARLPRLGAFGVSQTRGCPIVDPQITEFALGQQSDACRTFYNNATYPSINVYYWQPQCLLTVHTKLDCSDPGILSGLGCWSPEGGIAAYKVTVSVMFCVRSVKGGNG